MLNVCLNCGEYRADKIIDSTGPFAICPLCQHKHPFQYLPLLIICGPSATGKSTIANHLAGTVENLVVLDADILWRAEFNTPENQYRDFFETWLRMAKNIHQSGRPLLLFNAGAIPQNIEPCIERRYISKVHYMALTCDDDTLLKRLKARPSWRKTSSDPFIQEQLKFSQWFRENSAETNPPIQSLDTTNIPIETTLKQVRHWISSTIT